MSAAIELAREWDAGALVLDTGPRNVTAQRVYHRLGFVRVPERETRIGAGGEPLAVYSHDLGRGRGGVGVRLITAAEHDAVGELCESAYAQDYTISEQYRASLRDVGARAHEHEVWVAVHPESAELLGTVATPRPGGLISGLAAPGELDFRFLAVAPYARRRGVGKTLVRHVLDLGRLRGAERVVMNSGPQMTGAHRLYTELGFQRLPDRETRLADGRPLYAFGLDLDGAGGPARGERQEPGN